jgi:hypothetical protein
MVSSPPPLPGRTRRLELGALAAAAFLAGAFWLMRDKPSAEAAPLPMAKEAPAPSIATDAPRPSPDSPPEPGAAAEPPPPAPSSEAFVSDEEQPVTPHPISDERLALAPPWATVDEVKAALKANDFERARSLLSERRAADEHRADFSDFYDGLGLIADCLEHPGAHHRARAEAFITEHRSSPMRRPVRRKCGL